MIFDDGMIIDIDNKIVMRIPPWEYYSSQDERRKRDTQLDDDGRFGRDWNAQRNDDDDNDRKSLGLSDVLSTVANYEVDYLVYV